MSVCTIVATCRLGRDPVTREAGDTTVTSFSIAVNRYVKKEEQTDWYNVDAWGRMGENVAEHLSSGSYVTVSGSLSQREYEKDGEKRVSLDIRANDIDFGPKADSGAPTATRDEDAPSDDGGDGGDDNDIPF
jgi:single-strand DNA-binding protein